MDPSSQSKERSEMVIEARVSRLEGAYEQVDARLSDLQDNLNALRSETQSSMITLGAEINSRINTLYLLIIGSWVTILGASIALSLR